MKFKWGEERIKGFSSPIKKAEENNDWAWWGLFAATIIMLIIVFKKIS